MLQGKCVHLFWSTHKSYRVNIFCDSFEDWRGQDSIAAIDENCFGYLLGYLLVFTFNILTYIQKLYNIRA